MESHSRVKIALREGRQTFGLWQMIPGANVSRCLARAGADWVCVDCEHGNMDGETRLIHYMNLLCEMRSIGGCSKQSECAADLNMVTCRCGDARCRASNRRCRCVATSTDSRA